MNPKYKIAMWPVDKLRPHESNPRKISKSRIEGLKRSMRADPDFIHARPIIVNVSAARHGTVIDGQELRRQQPARHREQPAALGRDGRPRADAEVGGPHAVGADDRRPECVGFSEIDRHASAVLRHRFPNVKNYGDITKIDWRRVSDFDLLVGGSPCQDLSIAGKRAGLGGARSGLFQEFVRALKVKKPRYFIWENVKGALSSRGGLDFAAVLDSLAKAGYALSWQVLNAKDFGVPQNRERVFVIGARGGPAPEVFFEPEDDQVPDLAHQAKDGSSQAEVSHTIRGGSVKADSVFIKTLTPPGTADAFRVFDPKGINRTLKGESGGTGGKTGLIAVNRNRDRLVEQEADRANAIDANAHKDLDNHGQRTGVLDATGINHPSRGVEPRPDGLAASIKAGQSGSQRPKAPPAGARIRRLTPVECERLMSWPDGWTAVGDYGDGKAAPISDTQRYKMCGNGVVSEVVAAVVREMVL